MHFDLFFFLLLLNLLIFLCIRSLVVPSGKTAVPDVFYSLAEG